MEADSQEVSEFLRHVRELEEQENREDEERAKELERDILDGRRRRQALRNARQNASSAPVTTTNTGARKVSHKEIMDTIQSIAPEGTISLFGTPGKASRDKENQPVARNMLDSRAARDSVKRSDMPDTNIVDHPTKPSAQAVSGSTGFNSQKAQTLDSPVHRTPDKPHLLNRSPSPSKPLSSSAVISSALKATHSPISERIKPVVPAKPKLDLSQDSPKVHEKAQPPAVEGTESPKVKVDLSRLSTIMRDRTKGKAELSPVSALPDVTMSNTSADSSIESPRPPSPSKVDLNKISSLIRNKEKSATPPAASHEKCPSPPSTSSPKFTGTGGFYGSAMAKQNNLSRSPSPEKRPTLPPRNKPSDDSYSLLPKLPPRRHSPESEPDIKPVLPPRTEVSPLAIKPKKWLESALVKNSPSEGLVRTSTLKAVQPPKLNYSPSTKRTPPIPAKKSNLSDTASSDINTFEKPRLKPKPSYSEIKPSIRKEEDPPKLPPRNLRHVDSPIRRSPSPTVKPELPQRAATLRPSSPRRLDDSPKEQHAVDLRAHLRSPTRNTFASYKDDPEAIQKLHNLRPASPVKFEAPDEVKHNLQKAMGGLQKSETVKHQGNDEVKERLNVAMTGLKVSETVKYEPEDEAKEILKQGAGALHRRDFVKEEKVDEGKLILDNAMSSLSKKSVTEVETREPTSFNDMLSNALKRGPAPPMPRKSANSSSGDLTLNSIKKAATFDSSELSTSSKKLEHVTKSRTKGPKRRPPKSLQASGNSQSRLDTLHSTKSTSSLPTFVKEETSNEELVIPKPRAKKTPPAIRKPSRAVSVKQ